jgi:hypothetical protein
MKIRFFQMVLFLPFIRWTDENCLPLEIQTMAGTEDPKDAICLPETMVGRLWQDCKTAKKLQGQEQWY